MSSEQNNGTDLPAVQSPFLELFKFVLIFRRQIIVHYAQDLSSLAVCWLAPPLQLLAVIFIHICDTLRELYLDSID